MVVGSRCLSFVLWAGVLCSGAPAQDAPEPDRAAWMRQARWGVMNHYLADWIARRGDVADGQMTVERWNDLVDHFDVEALADQVRHTGAGYYVLTIGQNSGYYVSPNATYDEITGIRPSRLSRRDLIADVADAMHARGIKFIAYLPSGAPGGDREAIAALDFHRGRHRNKEFQEKWEQVIGKWSKRWGTKVDGWWFDGCYWPNAMYRTPEAPNFESFAAAARAGNPNAAVAFNPGVVYRNLSMTPHEDYIAGEMNDPALATIKRATDGKVDGCQAHMLSYLGKTWGTGEPRFTADQVVQFTRNVVRDGAAVTWDVPIQKDGTIAAAYLEQMTAVGKAMAEGPGTRATTRPVARPSGSAPAAE
jgi:alpha-L-fucosidase